MAFLAAIASLVFPGTGQALTGRWRLAAIWAIAGLVPIAAVFLWVPFVHVTWVVHVASAIDAAVRVRRARPGTAHLGLGGILAACSTVLAAVLGMAIEAFRSPASSMTPTLEIGDHFLVNKLAAPARGDLVVFWHPTGRQYVKRLIATGGDVVAVRDDVLYLNGTAAPRRDVGRTTYRDHDEDTDTWATKDAHAFEETLGGHRYRVLQSPRAPGDAGPRFHDFPRTDDAFFTAGRDPCGRHPMFGEREAGDARPQMTLSTDGKGCVVPPGTLFLLGDNRDNSNDSRSWGVVRASASIGVVIGIWWPLGRAGNVD